MTAGTAVDALLERLISQFASPYDFLRELVQNAMDAGSDRVEVVLFVHSLGREDDVVFELAVSDTGRGMDEAVIDGELTRLFSSAKLDDRTLAGGFGIGFVSVFAWEPEMVLVQTGRAGQAWELVFGADRRFEKLPIAEPVEGTNVILFRRGLAAERDAIAEAIRDSLWRWCRYCPLEITFHDVESGLPPELVQEAFELDADLVRSRVRGDTTLRAAFSVPPRMVLLRRGLILAEGTPAEHAVGPLAELGRSLQHLAISADSSSLRTTLARDSVLHDDGRARVEAELVDLVAELRGDLLTRLTEIAVTTTWTSAVHARYSWLHAHLALEREHIGSRMSDLVVIRCADGVARSIADIESLARRRPCLVASPQRDHELTHRAVRAGLMVVFGEDADRGWLDPLLGPSAVSLLRGVGRVEVASPLPVLADIEALFRRAGLEIALAGGRFPDLPVADCRLAALDISPAADAPLVLYAPHIPITALHGGKVWVDVEHPLVVVATRTGRLAPMLSALCVAFEIRAGLVGDAPSPWRLAEACDAIREGSS